MTEAKWLRSDDLTGMIAFAAGLGRERPLWLFTVACFARVGEWLDDEVRQAMETTERYADGRATFEEMNAFNTEPVAAESAAHAALDCQNEVRYRNRRAGAWPGEPTYRAAEARAQSELLRDIFGNPFRPVAFDPEWWTDTAVAIARQMYESRDFSAMPILADALQDADCDNADVLDHCRGPGPHVRGCWVVDLVLGNE